MRNFEKKLDLKQLTQDEKRDIREDESKQLKESEKKKLLGFLWEKGVLDMYDIYNEKEQKIGSETIFIEKMKKGQRKTIERRDHEGYLEYISEILLDENENFESLKKFSSSKKDKLLREIKKNLHTGYRDLNTYEVKDYDDFNGNLKSEKKYDNDGNLSEAIEYEHTADNQVSDKKTYSYYDSHKNECSEKPLRTVEEKNEYHSNGEIMEQKIVHYVDWKTSKEVQSFYDERGLIIKEIVEEGKTKIEKTFKYNDSGKRVEITEHVLEGDGEGRYERKGVINKTIFTYDDKGRYSGLESLTNYIKDKKEKFKYNIVPDLVKEETETYVYKKNKVEMTVVLDHVNSEKREYRGRSTNNEDLIEKYPL